MSAYQPPVIVDLETVPHPCAPDFLEPLDLDSIQAAKNLRDPQKIMDDVARRRAEAIDEHAAKLGRAALDWNVSRIAAIGWSTDAGETVTALACKDELAEIEALTAFWEVAQGRLLGFCIRTFDGPTLMQRSRLLSLPYFRRLDLRRYESDSIIDLRDVLTFGDMRYEALMPRSLKMFCRRFGLPVEDAIDGSDIGQLVADGKWDAVVAHVTSDVRLTAALAKRIGVLASQPAAQGVF